MGCQSSVILEQNLVFSICTHDPDTGVLTDADAAPDYRVYEDETATAILTGSMAKLDDSNTTGFYSEQIACTAANGFEADKSYTVYIEATVDSDKGAISFGFTGKQYADYKATGFAVAGDEMALIDDAITSDKYDEVTAFPLATEDSSDTASSALNTSVADATGIYNLALGLIDEYEIEDGDTTSKAYKYCNRYYSQALQKALAKHPWNEAMKDVTIMQETTAPLFGQAYKYAVPSDSIQVRAIGSDLYHWEVKGGYIQTDYARAPDVWTTATAYVAGQYVRSPDEAVTYLCDTSHTSSTWAADAANWTTQVGDYYVIDVEYIYLLTDTTAMTTSLIDTIAQELAIKIATGIKADGGETKKMLLEEHKVDILPSARSRDSAEGRLKPIYQSKWKRLRS